MTATTDQLEELLDKAAISAAIARYCRGVDRLEPDTIRSAYHPDGYDDHGDLKAYVEEFIERVVPLLRTNYVSTSHNICNQIIELDGHWALVESYLIAQHLTVDDTGQQWQEVVFGRYIDRFEKRDGDWRILHRVCVIDSRNTARVEKSRLATDESKIERGGRDGVDALYRQRSLLN